MQNSPLERGRGVSIHKTDKSQIKSKHTPNPSQEGTGVCIEVAYLIYVKYKCIIFILMQLKQAY